MKKLIALFMVLIMTVALVACGNSDNAANNAADNSTSNNAPATSDTDAKQDNQEPVTISWLMNETAILTRDKYEAIVAAFEADHPNIKIDLVLDTYFGLDQYRTRIAGDNMVDIFMNAGPVSVVEGALAEMPAELTEKFIPNYLTETYGAYRIIPAVSQGNWCILYNKAMFADAGITETPKTWEEFYDVCEKLADKGYTPMMSWGSTSQELWRNVWSSGPLANDINEANPNFNEQLLTGEAKWTDSYVKESFEDLAALVESGYLHKGYKSLTYPDSLAEFYAGNAAMAFEGVWGVAQDPELYGLFMPPTHTGTKNITMTNMYWGVWEGAENKDACWTFVDWVLCGDGQQLYTDLILAADAQISCAKDAVSYEMAPLVQEFYDQAAQCNVMIDPMYVLGTNALPGGANIEILNAILEVFFNGADIDETLSDLQAEYEILYAEQNAG